MNVVKGEGKCSPEFRIKTRSLNSRRVRDQQDAKSPLLLPGGNYASCLLQAGCFTWASRLEIPYFDKIRYNKDQICRAYYRNSYIMQRSENKRRGKETKLAELKQDQASQEKVVFRK